MSFTTLKNPPSTQGNVEEIHLGMMLGKLLDNIKLIVGTTALFTLVAICYALLATPVYNANVLIQIEQKQGNSLLSSLSQMLPDGQPQSAPEITLLQSRMILGKTVDALSLQTEIKRQYFPLLGKPIAKLKGENAGTINVDQLDLPTNDTDSSEVTLKVIDTQHYRLSGEGFEFEGQTGKLIQRDGISINIAKIDAQPGAEYTLTRFSRLKAISNLQESFNVADRGKDSGMLNLTLTGEDPQLLKLILNSISASYLEQNIARQAARDAKSLEFLNIQLPKIRSDLDSAEDKLNDYRKKKDSVDLNMEAKSALDQIVNVENQLNELTFREAEISQLYKKDHPTYQALTEKRQVLQNERARLNKHVSSMPSTQQEVLRLSRDVDSGRAVYLQLLGRQQELNVAKSSAIGNVRIIDDAVTLLKPIKPKKTLIVLIGMILGGCVSIAMVLLKAALHIGIESPEQLEERGFNVYACVPYSEWLHKPEWLHKQKLKDRKNATGWLLASKNPADPAIEAIRGLRTSLHFAMLEEKKNVLMISGISPGAGKTFISSNLAATIAQTQKKVLLIDADMRKGYMHELFGLKEVIGLAEILKGITTFEQAVISIPESGLDVLPRGHAPSNPAELLMNANFSTLIDKVFSRYDLIIIDTPPVLAVTDATIVGRYADTILMVAHFEKNTVKEAEVCIRRFEQNGLSVKGWLLNGVKKRQSSYYSYGYSAYGSAYGQEKK